MKEFSAIISLYIKYISADAFYLETKTTISLSSNVTMILFISNVISRRHTVCVHSWIIFQGSLDG